MLLDLSIRRIHNLLYVFRTQKYNAEVMQLAIEIGPTLSLA